MSDNTKFWLVWNGNTGYTRRRHLTKEAAITEAGRLAGENTGSTFFVLEALCIVRPAKPPVEVVGLVPASAEQVAAAESAKAVGDGIPF